MNLRFLREVYLSIGAARIASALLVVVSFIIACLTILTAGRSIAQAESLNDELASEQSRTSVVRDPEQVLLSRQYLATMREVSSVQRLIATGSPTDAFNSVFGSGGDKVAVTPVYGNVAEAIRLVDGRMPKDGEVILGTDAAEVVRIFEPGGSLSSATGEQWPVVGHFVNQTELPLSSLALTTESELNNYTAAYVLSPTLNAVGVTETALLEGVQDSVFSQVLFDSAQANAQKSTRLIDSLERAARSQMLLVQAVGLVVIGAVVLADSFLQARDFGRRRTLGMSRTMLVGFIMARVAMTSFVGSVVGVLLTAIVLRRMDVAVPLDYSLALVIIVVAVSICAAILPSVVASFRDPVRVLRTP